MDKQPKVKVGDRVKILNAGLSIHNGMHGTVTKICLGKYIHVDVDGTLYKNWATTAWEILQPTKEQSMTQQTFKVGDRMKLARVNPSPDGYFSTTVGMTGKLVDKCFNGRFDVNVAWDQLDGRICGVYSEHLQLLPDTLYTLVEGDVVVDKDDTGDTMTVAHVLKPGLYVLEDGGTVPLVIHTAAQLENLDYVPQQDPEDDKTWLTVAEVAKKLGLNPEKLHIVADKEAA